MTLAGNVCVHRIRRQIDLTRPRDRTAINEDPLEEARVPQGRKSTRQFFFAQSHTPSQPVLKSDEEAVVRFGLHFNYIPIHRTSPRLRQRLNSRRRCVLTAEPPVLKQLASMYHRPFQDQTQSPSRQLALDDPELAV